MSLGYKIPMASVLQVAQLSEATSTSMIVIVNSELGRSRNECSFRDTWPSSMRKRSPMVPPWDEDIYHYSFQRFRAVPFFSLRTEHGITSIKSDQRVEEADIIHTIYFTHLSLEFQRRRRKRERGREREKQATCSVQFPFLPLSLWR